MFATSTRTQGNIGGFAAADAFCQARATAAGLTGQFKAWLGSVDSGTTAASRLDPASGPFVRTCGGTIATNIADLLDGSIALPVGCNEFGASLLSDCTGSWSGTDSNGSASDGCNNWTRNDYSGRTANECATNSTWTQSDSRICTENRRIYCVEQQAALACGNGILEDGEQCDDGNLAEGDSCHADCTIADLCGNGLVDAGEQCDDGNLLDGDCCAATCQFETAGSGCGSGSNTECDKPDTCDGSGICQSNFEASSVDCGDAGTECTNQDKCDGNGSCTDNGFVLAATPCRNGLDTECDHPDTCDGLGTCQTNFAPSTANCGDAGTECVNQDKCDGSGACADNGFAAPATPCGSASNTACDNPDTCDGTGACQVNHEASTVNCGDAGSACVNQDKCDGSGACTDNGFVATGTTAVPTAISARTMNATASACAPTANTVACDDGDLCTVGDTCAGGSCTGGSSLAGDDSDGCTRDSCDPAMGCRNVVAPLPVQSCLVAPKTLFQLKPAPRPSRPSWKWKWIKGDAIDQAALGARIQTPLIRSASSTRRQRSRPSRRTSRSARAPSGSRKRPRGGATPTRTAVPAARPNCLLALVLLARPRPSSRRRV